MADMESKDNGLHCHGCSWRRSSRSDELTCSTTTSQHRLMMVRFVLEGRAHMRWMNSQAIRADGGKADRRGA